MAYRNEAHEYFDKMSNEDFNNLLEDVLNDTENDREVYVMSNILEKVNDGFYERQFTNNRRQAPLLVQLGIELLTVVKQQQERIETLEQERDQLFEERNMWIEASKPK